MAASDAAEMPLPSEDTTPPVTKMYFGTRGLGVVLVVLLLVADVVGRVVVRPGELQVGIVLALVGAPFFIALVRRRKLSAL